jgi:hypothetical protein
MTCNKEFMDAYFFQLFNTSIEGDRIEERIDAEAVYDTPTDVTCAWARTPRTCSMLMVPLTVSSQTSPIPLSCERKHTSP